MIYFHVLPFLFTLKGDFRAFALSMHPHKSVPVFRVNKSSSRRGGSCEHANHTLLSPGGRKFFTAYVLVQVAGRIEPHIMPAIETGSPSALIVRFYRHNPRISRQAVVTDGGKNSRKIVSQGVSIVVLVQLSLRGAHQCIDHDQLSV